MISVLDTSTITTPTPQEMEPNPQASVPDDKQPSYFPEDNFTRATHHTPYPAITPLRTDLIGRLVFISGASSYLGGAAALAIARAGAAGFVLTARLNNLASLDDLEKRILHAAADNGCAEPKILKLAMDILDGASIDIAVSRAREMFGSVDTLLNVSGCVDAPVHLLESTMEDWWKPVETNVRGTWAVTQAVLPLLRDSQSGTKWIVNYSSFAANTSVSFVSGYCISKLALLRLTEFLSTDLSSSTEFTDINVVAFHPGVVRSPLTSIVPQEERYIVSDSPDLSAESIVWLVKERRGWLHGRFVSCTWDLPELEEKKDEIVEHDALKMRLVL